MESKMLFAALSLVSKFKNEGAQEDLKSIEIQKNNEYILTGVYSNINSLIGITVNDTETEDYFYTFEIAPYTKIYRSGKEVDFSNVKDGDQLKVSYDGKIDLVYPPKLSNVSKIEILNSENKNSDSK